MNPTPTDSTADTPRPPGRPRRAGVSAAVLDAARELFDETGLDGFSIAEIERRTGIGKPTIYRRWPSVHALLFDALFGSLDGAVPVPDTGSATEDIRRSIQAFADRVSDPRALEAARAIMVAQLTDEAARVRWEAAMDRDRDALAAVFERGRRRGELVSDSSPRVLTEAFMSWVVYRCVVRGQLPTPEEIDEYVETVLS